MKRVQIHNSRNVRFRGLSRVYTSQNSLPLKEVVGKETQFRHIFLQFVQKSRDLQLKPLKN